MRAVFILFCLMVAVHGETCANNDVSTCVNTKSTCFANQTLACELGTCKCAVTCLQLSDCASVTCPDLKHCIDNACICDGTGGNTGGHTGGNTGGGNHHPGGSGHHG